MSGAPIYGVISVQQNQRKAGTTHHEICHFSWCAGYCPD
jgi:hypothetical protein